MFKEALKITNNSIIIALPMILGLKFIELYTLFVNSHADSNAKLSFATITLVLMVGLFAAGWFYVIKKTIETNKKNFIMEKDKYIEIFDTLKKIPEGIAHYFLSFVGAYVIFITLQILLMPLVVLAGIKLFGNLEADLYLRIQELAAYKISMNDFVNGLTDNQLLYFGKWILLFIITMLILLYLIMLWIPEIMYSTTNPIVALGKSVAKLFKDFFKTFGIFLSILVFVFIAFFAVVMLPRHPLSILFFECLKYYSYMYFTILIFVFYDKKYNTQELKTENNDYEE